MKKIERFYLVSAIVGFCVNVATVVVFLGENIAPALGLPSVFPTWVAVLSIITLFYGSFALASWRYWIWYDHYADRVEDYHERLAIWAENYDLWEKKRQAEEREINKGGRVHRPIVIIGTYDVPPPDRPRGYTRQGLYLMLGLGILIYPLIAVWGFTFFANIIWSASSTEFVLLLLTPFIFAGLAILTAIIIVQGIQYRLD